MMIKIKQLLAITFVICSQTSHALPGIGKQLDPVFKKALHLAKLPLFAQHPAAARNLSSSLALPYVKYRNSKPGHLCGYKTSQRLKRFHLPLTLGVAGTVIGAYLVHDYFLLLINQ